MTRRPSEPAGLLASFIARCKAAPSTVQFVLASAGGNAVVTHAMLWDGGQRYAHLYRRTGAAPGTVVLIALRSSPDLLYAFIGAILAGCVPAMMPLPSIKQDPARFWDSHTQLFRHIGGGILVADTINAATFADALAADLLAIVTTVDAVPDDGDPIAWDWHPDAVCCLQHSSGTTGLKKGVTLTSRAISHHIASYAAAIGLTSDDVICSWLPLYHDMGLVTTLLMPLLTGVRAVIVDPFDWLSNPLSLFDLVAKHDGTLVWLPNFAFDHLANAAVDSRRVDLSRVRAFINCSEPCKPASVDRFIAAFGQWGVSAVQVQACYAMAETVFAVAQTRPGVPARRCSVSADGLRRHRLDVVGDDRISLCSAGPPIDGIEVRIDGADAIGEILVRGDFVFTGYYRQDSSASFNAGWFGTGDLGFLHEGEVYVLGRKTDRIILLGKNFYAHEIEQVLNDVVGVKAGRAVAFGLFADAIGSETCHVVVERGGAVEDCGAIEDSALRQAVKRQLLDLLGLVPKTISIVAPGWLIKSTSGKISRTENIVKYLAGRHTEI
ncbi:acyl-CoA synthetase (AMP-forming)/AMP-acid ligase II [Sphingomonas sp. PP-F2F-A104-K0414]|uniref:AMP-binding protein n=1 Tax=Sphingomonas sp. PP-F2F-A104-K0414 TaxID=2135661 RepID=UPI00104C4EEA|nr:AMP-binding protein [Sphingomonas sp. PP-F2F-A104-K0414]TCQ00154.1 acyl-CoA synthetase (AMP-forming)/AMP-acid ligase II [Sphingomonas sp. PP-F2F-A104-K0414]